jgi:GDPmannose 4,6-dehydratase
VESKVALITGITGQDGSYLAELLLSKGYEVHGLKRPSSNFNTQRVDHLYQDAHLENRKFVIHYGDLTDASSLQNVIAKVRPDEIYNLAAQSHVKISFEIPSYTSEVDGLGALRILDSLVSLKLVERTKYYQASTSELFGLTDGTPLNESSPFYPRSPYAIAKLYAYWITKNYREAYSIFGVNGILFNHESPRRGETFVTKKITSFLNRIQQGAEEVLFLGNLDSVRDWGHAKDYVEAMWLTMQHSSPDDWVVATGQAYSVREFVNKAFAQRNLFISWEGDGLSEVGRDQNGLIRIQVDPRYFRPTEVPHLLGDSKKIRALLNWEPKYDLDQIITDMLAQF